MGLVHRIVPADQTWNEVLQLTDRVLQGGPQAVRNTKRLLADLSASPEPDGPHIAHHYHLEARVGDEAREGIAAFLERRSPRWA